MAYASDDGPVDDLDDESETCEHGVPWDQVCHACEVAEEEEAEEEDDDEACPACGKSLDDCECSDDEDEEWDAPEDDDDDDGDEP